MPRVPPEHPRCRVIAVLTLAGTLSTGTNSVLRLAEHQARTAACVAALGALQSDLFGETVREGAIDKARHSLDTIRLTYDEYLEPFNVKEE